MAGRVADEVVLRDEERAFWRRRSGATRQRARRRMILLCAEGLQSKEVDARLGVHEHPVGKWRRRFVKNRIEGLTDEYRPGRPRTVSGEQVNQVERWFAELTRKQLQRGVHRSSTELEADIAAFIEAHNENPKPCRWGKSADDILASVKRFRQRTQQTLSDKL